MDGFGCRGWLVYELTDSSFQLDLVRGVQALPILLLSPIAGSTADLYSRTKAGIVCADRGWTVVCRSRHVDRYGGHSGRASATSIGLATVKHSSSLPGLQ
jgi:hypothetical protein